MADFVKRAPFYCPDCGELDNTEVFDVQFDDEIIHKARCCKCGCEFIDRYVPRYAGYSIEREEGWYEYDEYGDEIDFTPNEDCNIYLNDDDPSDEDIEEALEL